MCKKQVFFLNTSRNIFNQLSNCIQLKQISNYLAVFESFFSIVHVFVICTIKHQYFRVSLQRLQSSLRSNLIFNMPSALLGDLEFCLTVTSRLKIVYLQHCIYIYILYILTYLLTYIYTYIYYIYLLHTNIHIHIHIYVILEYTNVLNHVSSKATVFYKITICFGISHTFISGYIYNAKTKS